MADLTTIFAGVVCALVGSVAPAILFENALKPGRRVSLAAGLASILSSFLFLALALLVEYVYASEKFLAFGCAMAAAFLLFWSAEALRAWRAANSDPKGLSRRKECS